MNSGIFCLYLMLVFAILFVSGWAEPYVAESRASRKAWGFGLLLTGCFSSFNVPVQGIAINLAVSMLFIYLLLYFLFILTWTQKLKFLLAATTAASVSFTLMVVVPRDPAFYFIPDIYLYPISAVCTAFLFSRKPLFVSASAVCGVIAAGLVFDNRFTIPLSGVRTLGSPEIMELSCVAFLVSFLMYSAFVGIELLLRAGRTAHKLDGDPS